MALETLEALKIHLTFFVVGRDAANPQHHHWLRAAVAAGHEIGNHSYEHEPWLHRYAPDKLAIEIASAEEAIVAATGTRPIGFRGPGYSWSPALFEVLVDRGYLYDASTLPTYLARWPARTTSGRPTSRAARAGGACRSLFGSARDGLRPVRPYRWSLPSGRTLLEIPVTTMPVLKTPFHLSYLLYLSRVSEAAMTAYLRARARRLPGHRHRTELPAASARPAGRRPGARAPVLSRAWTCPAPARPSCSPG